MLKNYLQIKYAIDYDICNDNSIIYADQKDEFTAIRFALKGVSKLIQKGLTLSEIKYLTGFETKKIEDVSRWLMNQEDVESVINNKLNLIDI